MNNPQSIFVGVVFLFVSWFHVRKFMWHSTHIDQFIHSNYVCHKFWNSATSLTRSLTRLIHKSLIVIGINIRTKLYAMRHAWKPVSSNECQVAVFTQTTNSVAMCSNNYTGNNSEWIYHRRLKLFALHRWNECDVSHVSFEQNRVNAIDALWCDCN